MASQTGQSLQQPDFDATESMFGLGSYHSAESARVSCVNTSTNVLVSVVNVFFPTVPIKKRAEKKE